MNLLEEEKKAPKNKKFMIAIGGLLAVIVIILIALIYLVQFTKNTKITVTINGVPQVVTQDLILKEEETGNIYIAIKDIASLVGYEAHNGEYKEDVEDANKCQVIATDETASFYLNSNIINKVKPNSTQDYVSYEIAQPVKKHNEKLYVSIDGIAVACNLWYAVNGNDISFYTLDTLYQKYNENVKTYGYAGLSDKFENKKAILYNLYVVKSTSGKYGVIDSKNTEIIGTRYNDIKFLEDTKQFFVTNSQKKIGIMSDKGVTKIELKYDELKLLDQNRKLYIVTSNRKQGVLNENGETIIYPEYDSIGIDLSVSKNSFNLENQYLLYENCIPIKQNNLWGLYEKQGNLILPIEYQGFGSTNVEVGKSDVLLIPEYKLIVVRKDDKYGLVDNNGKEVIPCELSAVYSTMNQGKQNFFIVYQGKTMNLADYMKALEQQN